MKSKIYSKEIIIQRNKNKPSDVYYPCDFKDQNGIYNKLLFTAQEIEDAKGRATSLLAPEAKKPWWKI